MITSGCTVSAALWILILLWFIRAHYFNAGNAGWGDPVQDRHEAVLGWGVRVSALIAVGSCTMIATRSRRALLSMLTGSALAIVSQATFWLIAPRFPHIPIIDWAVLFPGTVISLYVFGIHVATAVTVYYGLIINAAVYSSITFFFLWRRTSSDNFEAAGS